MNDILSVEEIEEAVFVEGNQLLDFGALEKVANAQVAKLKARGYVKWDREKVAEHIFGVVCEELLFVEVKTAADSWGDLKDHYKDAYRKDADQLKEELGK